jgi:hypothetical protein
MIRSVTKQSICGTKKHGVFKGTGEAKGNFAVSICDQPKHSGPWHRDSVTGEEWKA